MTMGTARRPTALLSLLLLGPVLITGCAPKIRIDDQVEPFRSEHPILSQVALQCEIDKHNSTALYLMQLHPSESFCEKIEEVLLKSGIVQTVVKGNLENSHLRTLRTVALVTYEANTGMAVVKSVVFTLLLPLLPFMTHTVTYAVSSDVFVIQAEHSAKVGTISSTMYLTRTLFNIFDEREVLPPITEDVSWKIALELKRHPHWLQPGVPK